MMSSHQEFSYYFSFATNCAVQPGPVYIRAIFKWEKQTTISRGFFFKQCVLSKVRDCVAFHGYIGGSQPSDRFASALMATSICWFRSEKKFIDDLCPVQRCGGWRNSPSVNFIGQRTQSRNTSFSQLPLGHTDVYLWSLACHGPRMSNPIFGF